MIAEESGEETEEDFPEIDVGDLLEDMDALNIQDVEAEEEDEEM